MEGTTWTAYAAVFLGTLFLLLLSKFLRQKKLNLPPGPKPWPIIGNLHLMGNLPHRSIHELSVKYGPILQLQFGSFPVVVGSSVEMAKIFLKSMDINFVGRPKTAAGKHTTYNYSDITWSPYGSYWRQARRMCLTELFSAKRLDSYEYIRAEELHLILRNLNKLSGKPILLKDYLTTLSLNVISRMVLGKRYLDESKNSIVTPEEFKKMLDELFLLNGVLNIGDSIPWLDFMDLQGYVKRMKVLSKKFDKFLEHVLDEHNVRRNAVENYVAKDMVDVLLQLADDPSLEIKLERHGVKAFTQDLLAGGTESSAVTVEWAISELLKKPDIIKKATEELDRVIGQNRWVQEKDIPNLPYIEAVVKETMRLHPVAPMLVPRECREDCKVAGYDVQKGTRVLVSVWTIGRDPTLWDEPEAFKPERFLEKSIDVKGHDFELLPFGAGRRMCPGYSLGLKVIQASLANLLHGFKWSLPDNMTPEDLNMEEIFGLSTPKKFPLSAMIEPRLPPSLYSRPHNSENGPTSLTRSKRARGSKKQISLQIQEQAQDFKIKSSKFKNKLKISRSRVQGSRTSSRFQDQEFKIQEQVQASRSRLQDSRTSSTALEFKYKSRLSSSSLQIKVKFNIKTARFKNKLPSPWIQAQVKIKSVKFKLKVQDQGRNP
ncbi:putative myosin-H heavy chain-like [Capsicum annuum]|nr:putative myosin-H heavy chain-like [Capsicum annuum]